MARFCILFWVTVITVAIVGVGTACAGPRQDTRTDGPAMRPEPTAPATLQGVEPPGDLAGSPTTPTQQEEATLGTDDLIPASEGRNRAKRAPVLSDNGFLFVEVEPPSARILVDGAPVGEGHVFMRVRGPRWKVLRVEAVGYEPVEGAVEVREREVTKVRLALQPIGGRLTVVTDVPGAEAFLNDRPVGRTPLTLRRVAGGVHRLVLRAGSWQWSGNVEIRPGETRLIEMTVGSVVPPAPPTTQPAISTVSETPVQPPPSREPPLAVTTPSEPERTSTPTPSPTTQTSTQSEQAPGAPTGRPDCGAICQRFVQAVTGSDSVREPIRNRCRDRCQSGDLRFSVCAWKARDMNDVATCMNLPE